MDSQIFELDFKEGKIRVQQRLFANQTIYAVAFSDKRKPLVLTRTTADNKKWFWTSVPQGRQTEADEIGPLIADYIKSNQ